MPQWGTNNIDNSTDCRGTWPWCSPLCRWHPTVWPLFTCQFFWAGVSSSSSYWLNSRVGVLEPALSQHRQDTIHLAWYEAQSCQERNRSAPQSTSVPDWTHICEESWRHYRSRAKHEGPYHQTLPVVLLPAPSNTHGSTFTYIISHPNFGPCLHLHASRFLQQPSLWDKCLPPWPSPIGPKFCCTFDPQNRQIWSDLGCNSTWPSLAPGSVSYSIQAQLHHEQLPGWPCTGYLIELCHSVNAFQQGATFSRRPRFRSWSLDIGRNDPGEEVSPFPHHSCGTYFLPTSDFSTTSINFSGSDSKLTICNSPCYATEDRCQQCDLYYYYYYYCIKSADTTHAYRLQWTNTCKRNNATLIFIKASPIDGHHRDIIETSSWYHRDIIVIPSIHHRDIIATSSWYHRYIIVIFYLKILLPAKKLTQIYIDKRLERIT